MLNYIKEGEKKIMNNNDYENLDDMLDEVDSSMTQYNEEKEYEIYVKNCQNEMKNSVKVFGGNTCGQILETMREPLGIIEIKGPSFTSEDGLTSADYNTTMKELGITANKMLIIDPAAGVAAIL